MLDTFVILNKSARDSMSVKAQRSLLSFACFMLWELSSFFRLFSFYMRHTHDKCLRSVRQQFAYIRSTLSLWRAIEEMIDGTILTDWHNSFSLFAFKYTLTPLDSSRVGFCFRPLCIVSRLFLKFNGGIREHSEWAFLFVQSNDNLESADVLCEWNDRYENRRSWLRARRSQDLL